MSLPRDSRAGGLSAYLGEGSKVSGNIMFDGPATLGGELDGEVKAQGRLEIAESAVVKARIEGTEVVVKGLVEGDVVATKKLLIMQTGKVVGNVSCESLHIEDGAAFEGSCKMLGSRSSEGASSGAGSIRKDLSNKGSNNKSSDNKSSDNKNDVKLINR